MLRALVSSITGGFVQRQSVPPNPPSSLSVASDLLLMLENVRVAILMTSHRFSSIKTGKDMCLTARVPTAMAGGGLLYTEDPDTGQAWCLAFGQGAQASFIGTECDLSSPHAKTLDNSWSLAPVRLFNEDIVSLIVCFLLDADGEWCYSTCPTNVGWATPSL